MSKPEWGTKRICQSCSAHFYDLGKDPISCPKCGAHFDPEAMLKKSRRAPEKVAVVKPVPVVAEDLPEVEVDEAVEVEEDDAVIEDTSELGEDDEDISEAIEKGDDDKDR